jgi:VWFA-related protein
MKVRGVIVAFCLCMSAIAVSPAYAQPPDAQGRPPVLTIRLDTDLVVIDVTATDRSGAYVRDLRTEEIQVFEDGQERKINFFAMNDEASLSRPLAVVFALDISGSLRPDEMSTLRQAAMKFTELMKGDSVFAALSFNHTIKIVQGFTPDPAKIELAFAKMNKFEGSGKLTEGWTDFALKDGNVH